MADSGGSYSGSRYLRDKYPRGRYPGDWGRKRHHGWNRHWTAIRRKWRTPKSNLRKRQCGVLRRPYHSSAERGNYWYKGQGRQCRRHLWHKSRGRTDAVVYAFWNDLYDGTGTLLHTSSRMRMNMSTSTSWNGSAQTWKFIFWMPRRRNGWLWRAASPLFFLLHYHSLSISWNLPSIPHQRVRKYNPVHLESSLVNVIDNQITADKVQYHADCHRDT